MNETEIERLVVRLLGDATSYLEMLAKAQQQTQQTMNQIKQHTAAVESFGSRMERAGAAAAQAMAFIGIGAGFHQLVESAHESELSVIKLQAVLEANGRDVEAMTARYTEFGKQLSETTMLTKGQARELLTLAESFGLTADEAERATKNAAALGEFTGHGSRAVFGITAAFEQGDTRRAMAFARQIPQLRGVKDELELIDKWEKLVASSTAMMAKEMELSGSKMKKAEQTMHEIGVSAGKMINEAMEPLADSLLGLTKAFDNASPDAKEWIIQTVALTAATLAASAGIRALWAVMLANPIAAVIALVFALTKALSAMTQSARESVKAQEEMAEGLKRINRDLGYKLEDNPNDTKAIEGAIARMKAMIEAEKARVHGIDWWNQTIGEATDTQKGIRDTEDQIKKWEDKLKEMKERLARAADPGYLAKMLNKQFEEFRKTLNENMGKAGLSEDEKTLVDLINKRLDPGKALELYNLILKKKFKEEEQKLRNEFDASGVKDSEKKIIQWMQQGFQGEHLGRLKDLAEGARLREDAYQTKEAQKSPEEKLKERIEDLNKELARGMLTWEQYGRAVLDARQKILGAAVPIGAAVEATSNAARVLLYETMERIRPSLPMIERPRGIPDRPNPDVREVGPNFDPRFPAGRVHRPVVDPEIVARENQAMTNLTEAMNNLAKVLTNRPPIGVANMEP